MNEELHELNAQMIAQEYIDKLVEEVAVLKAYRDVNEDFQKAWQELKEENDKLQGLYQDEHCMNLELGKIIECKNGTIATLAKTRDKLKEENEELKKENTELQENVVELIQLKEEERQLREGWHTQCEVIESLRTENERLNSACLQLQSTECKQYLEKVNCERDNYKFHKALEDIREIINKSCKQCKNEYLSEDYCSGQGDCYEIMGVINEVIGEQE